MRHLGLALLLVCTAAAAVSLRDFDNKIVDDATVWILRFTSGTDAKCESKGVLRTLLSYSVSAFKVAIVLTSSQPGTSWQTR
jgi:hypothetical protein